MIICSQVIFTYTPLSTSAAPVDATDVVPALNMRCERICKLECRTNISATFAVESEDEEKYEGLTNAPDDECYDEHYLKDMTSDEKEACNNATETARKHEVRIYRPLIYNY